VSSQTCGPISDLLDFAAFGRKRLVRKPIALDHVLRAATAPLESEIQESKCIVLAPTTLPVAIGDMVLLPTIFQNLIGNSLKFVAADVTPRIPSQPSRNGHGTCHRSSRRRATGRSHRI